MEHIENAVADADLTRLESAAAVSAATTNATDASKKIGYLGSKRYVTCDIVSTGTSSGATVGVPTTTRTVVGLASSVSGRRTCVCGIE